MRRESIHISNLILNIFRLRYASILLAAIIKEQIGKLRFAETKNYREKNCDTKNDQNLLTLCSRSCF